MSVVEPKVLFEDLEIELSYDHDARIIDSYSEKISVKDYFELLKEYSREAQVTNAFAKNLSKETGKVVLLWANHRGGIVPTRAIDDPLMSLSAKKRSEAVSNIKRLSLELENKDLATAKVYADLMKTSSIDSAVYLMEGKIPSSAAEELRSYYNSIDHLFDFKRRVERVIAEIEPVILFVDRSPSYRFPMAAVRFQEFMKEHFSRYEVSGVLAHNTPEIVRGDVDIAVLTGIKRVPGEERFSRLVSRDYFSFVAQKDAPQAIILNPERKRYGFREHLYLGFDDDVPEFFGFYSGQTIGRGYLLLTDIGVELLSDHKDRFIRDYSGWTKRNSI